MPRCIGPLTLEKAGTIISLSLSVLKSHVAIWKGTAFCIVAPLFAVEQQCVTRIVFKCFLRTCATYLASTGTCLLMIIMLTFSNISSMPPALRSVGSVLRDLRLLVILPIDSCVFVLRTGDPKATHVSCIVIRSACFILACGHRSALLPSTAPCR